MITRADVIFAYEVFLKRQPENEGVIKRHLATHTSLKSLMTSFLECNEFTSKNIRPYFDFSSPQMKVYFDISIEQMEELFKLTESVWKELGENNPYHSVLTNKKYLGKKISEQTENDFYQAGKDPADRLIATLKRHCGAELGNKTISEIGCGTGRVTLWLGEQFQNVFAYDISENNLCIAKNKCATQSNIKFHKIEKLNEYTQLNKTDFIYSLIVLQHNPPPVIKFILMLLFKTLNEDGIIMFQVPTYKNGYNFIYENYIKTAGKTMEMHCFPQSEIFKIANDEHCIPLEVYQDGYAGSSFISTTFVFKKLTII